MGDLDIGAWTGGYDLRTLEGMQFGSTVPVSRVLLSLSSSTLLLCRVCSMMWSLTPWRVVTSDTSKASSTKMRFFVSMHTRWNFVSTGKSFLSWCQVAATPVVGLATSISSSLTQLRPAGVHGWFQGTARN